VLLTDHRTRAADKVTNDGLEIADMAQDPGQSAFEV
jgi:hypothetical protein